MLQIVGDKVFFRTKFGKYTGNIKWAVDGFYFQDDSGFNFRSLRDAGFKSSTARDALFEKILGYYPKAGGEWPWCKTREDVIKVLKYLTREDRKNFIQLNTIVW